MRKRNVLITLLVVLVLTIITILAIPHSPLEKEPQVQALKQQGWADDVLLPTYLPGKSYLDHAKVYEPMESMPPTYEIETDLMIPEVSEIVKLTITVQQTNETELQTVSSYPIQTIHEIMKKPENQRFYQGIKKIAEIEMKDGTGYWYAGVDVAHGNFTGQRVEFIQELHHIYVETNLLETQFPKEELIKIAQSFRIVQPDNE